MIKLKSETETPSRRSRLPRLFVLLILVAVVALVIERWRGQWALKSWKRHMVAQGEAFEPNALWPPLAARSAEFSSQLAEASTRLPQRLGNCRGQLSGIVTEMSYPTSPSSSVTGTWPASTKTSPPDSTWAIGIAPSTRSREHWTIYTSCSITTTPTAGC